VPFINKIDRRGARDRDLMADIRRKLVPSVFAVNAVRALGTPAAAVAARPLERAADRASAAEVLADHDNALLARLVDGSGPATSWPRSACGSRRRRLVVSPRSRPAGERPGTGTGPHRRQPAQP
jgi:ribosomal protection tetracycline resistance protein